MRFYPVVGLALASSLGVDANCDEKEAANTAEVLCSDNNELCQRVGVDTVAQMCCKYQGRGKPKSITQNGKYTFCKKGVCTEHVTLAGLWGYGCWCNFGHSLMQGAGTPVNIFDQKCRDLQRCLRCVTRDAANGGYECDPKTNEHNSTFVFGDQGLGDSCSKANPGNECGAHTCMCELDFIDELLKILFEQLTFDPTYHHSIWDSTGMCPVVPGIVEKDCCGYYPDRFPYSTIEKGCCKKTQEKYNVVSQQCCGKFGVFPIGTCP